MTAEDRMFELEGENAGLRASVIGLNVLAEDLSRQVAEANCVAWALYRAHEEELLIPPDALREAWPMAREVAAAAREEVDKLRVALATRREDEARLTRVLDAAGIPQHAGIAVLPLADRVAMLVRERDEARGE